MTNTTQNKPATALPWKAHSANKASNFGNYEAHIRTVSGLPLIAKARGGESDTADAAKQNAAYIVHACNAYPELVAALHVLADSCTPVHGDTPRTPHPAKVRVAIALLRELGEAE